MKGSALSPLLSIESLIASVVILSIVVTGMAFGSSQFLKAATLEIQSSRVTNTALLVQSESMTIRSEMEGYNITYIPESHELQLSYAGKKSSTSSKRIEGAYSRIVAPTTSTRIKSYLCFSNTNNALYITVDRCPS